MEPGKLWNLFVEYLRKTYAIELTDQQLYQFKLYYDLIIEKNKVMNLTAITEHKEFIEKHYLDSLALVRVRNLSEVSSLLDLGTGAGFPGIPLKILYPDLTVTLVDSLQKRLSFLDDVIRRLNLTRIATVHGRAEELARQASFREQYDLVVSRAVASLSTLSEYCLPYVRIGGSFVAYKGDSVDTEVASAMRAITTCGGSLELVDHFAIHEQSRAFVVIRKEQATPKQYPRKAGTPSKKPIA